MNAPYEHPPRSLGFYLAYLGFLLFCLSPSLVIVPIWVEGLNYQANEVLALMAGIALLQLLVIALPILMRHTVVTDVGLPKDTDISYQMLPYPKTLNEAVMLLEMEGFERLGEIETATVAAKMPHPQWIYASPKGHIVVGLLEVGQGVNRSVFVGFTTYGANGNVTTTYPQGHQLRLKHSRYSGVNNSIEAAYAHHRQEVQAWMAEGNRPIAIGSVQQYIEYDLKNGSDNRTWIRQALIDELLGYFFLFLALTPSFLLLASSFLPNIYGGLMRDGRLYVGGAILVIGLLIGLIIGQRSKGIKVKAGQRKSKSKAKRKLI